MRPVLGTCPFPGDPVGEASGGRGEERAELVVPVVLVAGVCQGKGAALIGQRGRSRSVQVRVADQGVDAGQPAVPRVAAGQVVPSLAQVTVGLQEHNLVTAADDPVDEGAPVTAATVGRGGDAGAEKPPEAVADPHRVTHHPPSSSKPSRPLAARHCRAILGVPQMGLPLTLSEVLISTGIPVRAANLCRTSARNGLASTASVCTRAVPLAWTTAGIISRARALAGTATDMYGLGWMTPK